MRRVDFINFLDIPGCGQRNFGSAALNSSTGMAPASSARNWARPGGVKPVRASAPLLASFLLWAHAISAAVSLSHQDAMGIGRRIWLNECGGTVAGLTSWNAGENFASLGIGHFIWYPKGVRGPFDESFPKFIQFASGRGVKLPPVAASNEACPWKTRAEFNAAAQSESM